MRKKIVWFKNLDEFIKKYNFRPNSLPWARENDHYRINQVVDEDSYGFPIYSITCKRYIDDSSFRGRLPNSVFAEEVLMAIAEDYTLETLDRVPTLNDPIKDRDDTFLENLSLQTDFRVNYNIHISIDYSYIDSSTFEFTYLIRYFPKDKEHLKRGYDERIESFQCYGGSYSGAWGTYEEALDEAIKKANTLLDKI